MNSTSLTAADGHTFDAYRAEPSIAKPRGAIVVLQEIFGVNGHIRSVADGFAADGWVAIAPALFDRVERGVETGYTPPDIERGKKIRGGVKDDAALLDIAAAVDAVKSVGKVAVVGYCWGGTLAWLAACKQRGLSAAVAYYGGGIGDMLDLEPQCPVLAHFGDQDHGIPLSVADDLKKKHPDVGVHIYHAGHGFNCDQRGSFDPASAALARERTVAFLKQYV